MIELTKLVVIACLLIIEVLESILILHFFEVLFKMD
jgi:hypothetical protein